MSDIVTETEVVPAVAVEHKFKAALSVIRGLPKNGSYKPSPEMMLKFYSYYKQATEGPCTKAKPWAWDVINKAKWDAWSKLGNMTKAEAMENYVHSLTEIVEAMPATDNVQSFIQLLGNFYEVVEIPPPKQYERFSKLTSTPMREQAPMLNGNGVAHNGINGLDNHPEMDDSSASESAHSHEPGSANTPSMSPKSESQNADTSPEHEGHSKLIEEAYDNESQPSDSEDEFCDTAEDITGAMKGHPSLSNSYTMVNSDGNADSGTSSKSDSLSTLDETFGETRREDDVTNTTGNESQPMSAATVKVRSRGGEYGARGADSKMSSSSQRGASQQQGRGRDEDGGQYSGAGRQRPGGAPGRGGERPPPVYSYSEQVQDQIATTLLQLQQDMNSVLNRLTILEALTVGQQARKGRTISDSSNSPISTPRQRHETVPSWWPFSDLSPRTAFFILLWPFVARWIMYVIKRRRHLRR